MYSLQKDKGVSLPVISTAPPHAQQQPIHRSGPRFQSKGTLRRLERNSTFIWFPRENKSPSATRGFVVSDKRNDHAFDVSKNEGHERTGSRQRCGCTFNGTINSSATRGPTG